jgi:NADPH:quinone reductase-like Zn-dependent oxidoreductase
LKAALFHEHGAPEVIRVEEIPSPEPGPGQVRLRVRASSLNHLDLWVRRGLPIRIPMPHIGGSDISGEVDAVGPGVTGVAPGTRVVVDPSLEWDWYQGVRRGPDLPSPRFQVLGEHTQGGFAEYAVVPADNLLQLPDDVAFETAAAASLVFVTAWRALMTRAGLRAGERVLITGGSGGVSTAAVQLARHAGATVFVLTSGAESCRRLEALGAHVALDRTSGEVGDLVRQATGREGVDVVLDSVGEAVWDTLIRALAPAGRLVTYGATTGPKAVTDLRHVFWKQLSILGSTMGSPGEFHAVMRLVFQGAVAPVVHSTVPLEGVGDAHALLEGGGVFGKVVVVPG